MTDLDTAFARIVALAERRGLAGITRAVSYGTPALKAAGITFCRLRDAQTLVLLCPEDQKALLMEISPETYFETGHYVGRPAVLIRLGAIADEELALRLEDASHAKASAARQQPRSASQQAGRTIK